MNSCGEEKSFTWNKMWYCCKKSSTRNILIVNIFLNRDMNIEEVKKQIRDVYDFPEKGIVFKDLTTAFKDAACMSFFENEMYRLYKDKGITKVIGIESRGFIMAPILGNKLGDFGQLFHHSHTGTRQVKLLFSILPPFVAIRSCNRWRFCAFIISTNNLAI